MVQERHVRSPTKAVLRLMVLSASIAQRLDPLLTSVHRISLSELLLLLNLESAPLHRMRRADVAAAMGVGASSISHIGDPLEKEGLVRKELDVRDARVAYMTLTQDGLLRVAEALETIEQFSARLFDDRWQEQDLINFLGRLAQLTYGSASRLVDW
jgi:DNA-binding MarR family transcriptional regulator